METQHTAILYRKDNLCHVFYNNDFCILFDAADPEILYKIATQKVITKNFYKNSEINNMEDLEKPRKILYVYTTHHHKDHSAGNSYMLSKGIEVIAGDSGIEHYNKKPQASKFIVENIVNPFIIKPLKLKIHNLSTPCHTLDSFCFYIILDDNRKFLITGDTFFFLFVGKFFEGTSSQMVQNIKKICKYVDEKTIFLYGHDYRTLNTIFLRNIPVDLPKEVEEKIFLSLEEERKYNPAFGKFVLGVNDEIANRNLGYLRECKDKGKKISDYKLYD